MLTKNLKFQITNHADHAKTLCIEPYGYEYSIAAGQKALIQIEDLEEDFQLILGDTETEIIVSAKNCANVIVTMID